MRMTELRAVAGERELRGYSKLRKAELIAFIRDNKRNQPTRTPPRPALSRLLSSQNTKCKVKEHFCMNCLQGFKEESSRDEHIGYCKNNASVHIGMPYKNPIKEYSDGQF